ncbi:AAA+ ATPase domain-containing protein [Artemisia annua]|uniref:AAA+ ATPase domain-containing protein n=1 Tax=Artemisia annua TaxID=35608 RepID=A0A2U1LKH0_ARTAN|nr:AAA+ ATPase domain-containing protein [Artemisia annua]
MVLIEIKERSKPEDGEKITESLKDSTKVANFTSGSNKEHIPTIGNYLTISAQITLTKVEFGSIGKADGLVNDANFLGNFCSLCIASTSSDKYDQVVHKSLVDVRLTEATRVRARSYSGGMKRHLSVAISLIGDPKLAIIVELAKKIRNFNFC